MKITLVAGSLAFVSLTTMNALGSSCPDNYTDGFVSGTVSTQNISETQQAGTINMKLTKNQENGKVLFEQSGTVFGTITGQTEKGPTLSHVITFADGNIIVTFGDQATFLYPTSNFSFVVNEVISNFWGTGVFKRATGTIDADGSISVPPCENSNQFELSGTVCLFKDK